MTSKNGLFATFIRQQRNKILVNKIKENSQQKRVKRVSPGLTVRSKGLTKGPTKQKLKRLKALQVT